MRKGIGNGNPQEDEVVPPNLFKRVEGHVQSRTLSGLLDLVPAIVTIVVLVFVVEKADALIRPLPFVADEPWDFAGVGLISIAVVFYLVGLVKMTRIGNGVFTRKNELLSRLPIIKAIFGVTQQVMTSFSAPYSFSRVVFMEWPREGMMAMGFVTGRALSVKTKDSMAIVYIPTIPNPTSGNMALVMEDDLIETDLEVEDAMKLVFSGGIVLPEVLSFARVPRERPEELELIGQFETEFRYASNSKLNGSQQ
ncbi:MAG: DUF502 domain-containing protein [Chloroflexi bacterium]|nr:DUF502 domain-containing protein [Chloroflexota bacterium]